ncbi:MAG: YfhO family protein [Lachnospiraceae bacterium]|nr:YfhO family protein [Lachnospiraceae bacterium]
MAERINALYHKKKLYPLYSALLTALIFILILAFNGIAGFGNKTILTGDLFSQYVSFIRHFIDILKGKAGFYYSFSLYLGNSSAANNSYYCLSPFNLLYLIPGISLSAMTAVIITLKLALSAASFQFYLAKGLKGGRPVSILFGTAYALSCFSVTMSMHIMWLDCLYILPVLLLLMMRFIKGGSFLPLIPAYAFLFLSNFYMAYIAGIFTAFCFIGLIIIHTDSFDKASLMSALRKGGLYALSVILAALCCAAVLLPSAYELISQRSTGGSTFSLVSVTIPDVLCNLLMGQMQGMGSPIPLIYCGLPVVLLLPLYFSSKAHSLKEKLCIAAILIFYLAGSQFLPLYRFIHAFEAPNWYAHRYAFCVVFLLLSLAFRALDDISSVTCRSVWAYYGAVLLFYALLIPFQRLCYSGYTTNSHGWLIVNAGFLGFYSLILSGILKHSRRLMPLLLSIVFSAELLINGITCLSRNSFGFESEDNIENWLSREETIIPVLLREDPDFYRVRVRGERAFNSPSHFSYPGLNSYSSTDNVKLRSTLSSLGIGTSFATTYDQGYTDLTDMLFSVKYTIDENGGISGSPLALPIGFMCSEAILGWKDCGNVFENQENLIDSMTEKKYDIFRTVSIDKIDYKNMEILPFQEAYVFKHHSDMVFNGRVIFSFPDLPNASVLGHFTPQGEPVLDSSAPSVAVDRTGFGKAVRISDGTIFALPLDESGTPVAELDFGGGGAYDYAIKDMQFCLYDTSSIPEIRKDLGTNVLKVSEWSDGHIKGSVTVTEDRPVLFTSIPYEKGWEALVDGKKAAIGATVNGTFISLALSPGEHIVELDYVHPMSGISLILSSISVCAVLLICLILRRRGNSLSSVSEDNGKEAAA